MFLQENPVATGVNESTNGINASTTVEINDFDEPVKTEEQFVKGRKELALDLRCFMNRAPITVRWVMIWYVHHDSIHF